MLLQVPEFFTSVTCLRTRALFTGGHLDYKLTLQRPGAMQVVEPQDDHTHPKVSDFNSQCSVELTFFGATTVAESVNKFQIPHFFVESKASILYSLEPITDPYFEPDESISHLHNIFILILFSHLHLCRPIYASQLKLRMLFHMPYALYIAPPHASPPPVCDVRVALEMSGRK
jgi:hypothetical protein